MHASCKYASRVAFGPKDCWVSGEKAVILMGGMIRGDLKIRF